MHQTQLTCWDTYVRNCSWENYPHNQCCRLLLVFFIAGYASIFWALKTTACWGTQRMVNEVLTTINFAIEPRRHIICIYVKMFFFSALLSRHNGAFKLYLALRIKSCQSGLVRLLFQLIGWVCNCPVVYHLYYTNNPLQNLDHRSVSCMSYSKLFLG